MENLMNIKEARAILKTVEVPEHMKERAAQAMIDKIHKSKASGLYKKQGGTLFELPNDRVAWVTTWTFGGEQNYYLTQRGEVIYCGADYRKCAEMLYKLGIASKDPKFLECSHASSVE